MYRVFRTLGTPNEDTWPGVTQLPDYKSSFPKWSPHDLAKVVPCLDSDGADLVKVRLNGFGRFSGTNVSDLYIMN